MPSTAQLRVFAEEIRLETMKELESFGVGHIGGALSIVELLAVLYGEELSHDPKNPGWEDRDRLVVSKGHAGPAVYAALALRGFFPMDMLDTLNRNGTKLPSHCDRRKTPGIDMTTGSLGQGASTAAGIAMGLKMLGRDCHTYLVLGDGEINEGQVWEMALFAPNKGLGRLIAFVDYNKQQLDGGTEAIMDLGDVGAKFEAFGWHTQTVDGHDIGALQAAIRAAKAETALPSVIVMHTIKGHGCLYAESKFPNHSLSFGKGVLDESFDRAREALAAARAEAEVRS